MSVIHECQPGDKFYCLQEFVASPHGQGFSWDTCRTFRVGEPLRYVSYFKYEKENHDEFASDWRVIFYAVDGKRYSATQTYFVTEECWQGLKEHFVRRFKRKTKSKNRPTRKLAASRR